MIKLESRPSISLTIVERSIQQFWSLLKVSSQLAATFLSSLIGKIATPVVPCRTNLGLEQAVIKVLLHHKLQGPKFSVWQVELQGIPISYPKCATSTKFRIYPWRRLLDHVGHELSRGLSRQSTKQVNWLLQEQREWGIRCLPPKSHSKETEEKRTQVYWTARQAKQRERG